MVDGSASLLGGAAGGEDDGASGGEGEADQALACDFEIRQAVGRDLHDATGAGERGGDVEIAVHVEGEALRPSQAFVESRHSSAGIDLENAVIGTGDEQVSVRTERQVIGGNAEFE